MKKTNGWAIVRVSKIMTPAKNEYSYAIYPERKMAENIAKSWSESSGRTYKVIEVEIIYAIQRHKRRKYSPS